MNPLSQNKRHAYLLFFSIVFIICVPLFILYAKGYRFNFNKAFQISETGGLYINADQSGVSIYVNDEIVRKTSIVQKGIFVQSLKPGEYQISASKNNFQTWNKTLKVFPEIVTEARSFSLKNESILTEIPKNLTLATSSLASASVKRNPEYDLINALFATTTQRSTKTSTSTTSADVKTARNMLVRNENGKLHAYWNGDADSIPNYFCESNVCKSEIVIESANDVKSFDFFPGRDDLIIMHLENGIYVSEIDDRSPQNMQSIALGLDYDFRVKDGSAIYIKKDTKIYSIAP
jgi:hypothetical protein